MKNIYLLATALLIACSSFGAELFVRVVRSGFHTAIASNQVQSNTTNIFRFFELPGGNINLQVTDQQNGMSVYSGILNIGQHQRVVAEIDGNGNLIVLQTFSIVCTNWYTTTTNGGQGNLPPYGNGGNSYGDPAFSQFLQLLDNESFDSKKLESSKKYADKTGLSAQQIADIAKKFTFDSNRLDWAKYAYKSCYDKANYFLLKSTFSFSSNYSALEDFIEGQ